MKKIYYITTFLILLVAMPALAQRGGNRPGPEQLKALKTAHITNALDLTSEEAKSFWPVYNEYEKRMENIRKERRNEFRQVMAQGQGMSDQDATAVLEKFLSLAQSELDERKTLVANLNGIISPLKILKLQQAEETFKRKLLEEIQRRKRN